MGWRQEEAWPSEIGAGGGFHEEDTAAAKTCGKQGGLSARIAAEETASAKA